MKRKILDFIRNNSVDILYVASIILILITLTIIGNDYDKLID